eukprot:Polyplicarium_translucidae@DN2405_c0_g1_i1.p2
MKGSEEGALELEALGSKIEGTTKTIATLRSQVQEKRTGIAERRQWLGDIERNLRLKEVEEKLRAAEADLREFDESMRGQNPKIFRQAVEAASAAVTELTKMRSHKDGETCSTQEWQARLKKELSQSKFERIDSLFRDALVQSETIGMAVKDLQKYHAALDKALMNYHTMKMTEINKSIKELWQATYRNTDIDFIAIRSNTEDDSGPGLRSYNYRVVIVQNNIEVDMRGRCSAGQKVLASIIIRLALAESFGTNCGVLALDEPTTNLDRSNIEGLAAALAELIQTRKSHANFQLVLITHDEEFVRLLARHQHCDHFFSVSKVANGHSTIRKMDIRGF